VDNNVRVLVLGGGGMLGEAVYQTLHNQVDLKMTDIDLNQSWLSKLDVRSYDSLKKEFERFKPQQVWHLAALVDLEWCEEHSDEAYHTNAVGTENVALLCAQYDATMVYISTAGIFDGEQDFYNDYDLPLPLSIYGKSKYAGELFVQQNLSKYFVFRAGWMMGGGPSKDKKFVNKIIKQINQGKKELFVVDDKLGSPTYTFNFVENLMKVLASQQYGVYNMVSKGNASRFEVAQEILKCFDLQSKIVLTKVNSDHWEKEYFASRPRSEQLINLKLELKDLNGMLDWKENLKNYLNTHSWGLDVIKIDSLKTSNLGL
jgi:dTDP-4-dehydrorhamnose reductase